MAAIHLGETVQVGRFSVRVTLAEPSEDGDSSDVTPFVVSPSGKRLARVGAPRSASAEDLAMQMPPPLLADAAAAPEVTSSHVERAGRRRSTEGAAAGTHEAHGTRSCWSLARAPADSGRATMTTKCRTEGESSERGAELSHTAAPEEVEERQLRRHKAGKKSKRWAATRDAKAALAGVWRRAGLRWAPKALHQATPEDMSVCAFQRSRSLASSPSKCAAEAACARSADLHRVLASESKHGLKLARRAAVVPAELLERRLGLTLLEGLCARSESPSAAPPAAAPLGSAGARRLASSKLGR
mmetsp:Transcript_122473/g.354001  ORF Transcript_122473/g.354001 Transcript_122473/m.354001 type:complete len:300 (-) Transcript_122473:404-1303(-)